MSRDEARSSPERRSKSTLPLDVTAKLRAWRLKFRNGLYFIEEPTRKVNVTGPVTNHVRAIVDYIFEEHYTDRRIRIAEGHVRLVEMTVRDIAEIVVPKKPSARTTSRCLQALFEAHAFLRTPDEGLATEYDLLLDPAPLWRGSAEDFPAEPGHSGAAPVPPWQTGHAIVADPSIYTGNGNGKTPGAGSLEELKAFIADAHHGKRKLTYRLNKRAWNQLADGALASCENAEQLELIKAAITTMINAGEPPAKWRLAQRCDQLAGSTPKQPKDIATERHKRARWLGTSERGSHRDRHEVIDLLRDLFAKEGLGPIDDAAVDACMAVFDQ